MGGHAVPGLVPTEGCLGARQRLHVFEPTSALRDEGCSGEVSEESNEMIHGFQITEKLHETRQSMVYRAIRVTDQCRVVLKMLNSQYPTPHGLARYRQEYDLIRSLSVPGVIQAYGLEKLGNTIIIVLEDFGGSSLSLCFEQQRPTIEQLLDLAIQTTAALGQLHQQGIIHKDINPSNIVWNARSGQLKIIDFGIATRLSNESPGLKDPGLLEGTLPFISPEQTGRMNRRLDYRTDFYSLGVTLYELLTGQLPFDRSDALELVHCQIAAQPRPPAQLRDDTPPVLSHIIMKLLAKTAEDRYQSAGGLRADLERCLEQVRSGEESTIFPLAREDVSERFAIPQKLYGRSVEISTLLDAFERVSQGRRETVLVTGYSGIGKSSLVRELYKPITRKSAFFVAGKFDLLQRATPYSALVAACTELVKQLLTRSQHELLRWREALLAALGPNGRLLIDLIPELELVIGPQPAVEELGPTEAQNRMILTFCNFLRVFCTPAHPLVIFLDDLQWVDAATLRLLEPMMSSEDISHFLLIGAYRDNEVDSAHPLHTVLQGLADQSAAIHTIRLHPLGLEDMMQMLADTLHRAAPSVRSLAELVLRRTGGNPFFINELLKTLHEGGLLRFDASTRDWRWDLSGIEAMPVTDSVAELLSPKLRRFPEETQELLRLAACIGNHFDLDTIAIIADRSLAECARALMAAVREGYILPAAEPEVMETETPEPQFLVREYRFAHDRVQQAAYALIPEEQRTAIHLEIGRHLLVRLGPEAREERLFEVVDHLDLGRALLDTLSREQAVTPVELARLNLAAGIRAREATAYAAAVRYLAIGLELAGPAWDEHYDLRLSLHIEGAMAEYCHGAFERSQMLIDAALSKVTSVLVKARLYQMLIVQYTAQARFEEVFRTGREALRMLGQPLPQEHELAAAAQQELARNQQLLGDRPIESLVDAPEMQDETHRAAIELMATLVTPSYLSHAEMFNFVTARMVNSMLEHGQSMAGGLGYVAYGSMLSTRFGDYQRGYQFDVLALRLADRYHSAAAKCRAGTGLSGTTMPWVRPLKEVYPISIESYEAALQCGELQFASLILLTRQVTYFHHGMSLERILDESSAGMRLSKRNNNALGASTLEGLCMVAAYLSDDRTHDGIASMEADAEYIARCRQELSLLGLSAYYVAKCQALYLEQEYERALEAALEAEKLHAYLAGVISVAFVKFYHSLCLAALFPQSSAVRQEEYWRSLESHQAQVKLWGDNCPENFRHMYLLVAAEMARITGDHLGAMDRYLQAIEFAEQNEFRQDVALANELAARFFLARGQTRYAMFHMREAHYSYTLWGAKRKVAMLEAQHGELLGHPRQDSPRPGESKKTTRPTTSTASTSEQLELASVIKASQVLSSEISLDRLLARLIEIVIESAGAQHGYFIWKRRDRLVVEARGTLGAGDVEVLTSLPLEGSDQGRPLVSTAIVHYVLRTRETVVLQDAVHEGPFVADPHVVATGSRSILCMPLLHQGNVSGVVYLENNLSPHAFTPARVELLALLSSQMAISLDNSFLYSNLQRANQDLERLLYSIAHDLKEPLRTVQSFSELLERRHGAQIDDQGRDYLTRVFQAGQHLRNLLEAIRIIAKIRRIEGPHEPIPGERLVQRAVKRLQPVIEQTRATVRVAEAFPRLAVDPRWASEALYQLVQNSLQYTRDGLAPEIDIEPYDGTEGVGFVVMDRGTGIPEEHAESMFDLFRRAVGREVPGTGAGLAIVRQVAAKHGGNAWLRPRRGGGTEVYITFN